MRKSFVRAFVAASCLSLAASWTALAQSGDLSQYLKPGHPDVYTVVKGDTLWDISGRFLERPWLWPELWRVNPQVDNPHLIYPGDQIALEYVDGQPRLTLQRGDASRTVRVSGRDNKLSPQIRSTPLDTAIPSIPLDAVQGFLVQNRVVAPAELDGAPYVVQGESERLVTGSGDRLYVRGILPDSVSYNFVSEGPVYIDPETEEVLGQEATYVGLGKVVGQEGDIATMFVNSIREEISIGDRVLPTEQRKVESTFFPSAPTADIDGVIIHVVGGVTSVGQFDVVVLNRGLRDGLENGHVLSIWKRGALSRDRIANETIRLPSERSGLLMVFRVFEKMSYGLVLRSSTTMSVNDEVRNP